MAIEFDKVDDERTIENFDQIVWDWIELFNGLNSDKAISIASPEVCAYLEPESFKTGRCLRDVFMKMAQKCQDDVRGHFQERCRDETSITYK